MGDRMLMNVELHSFHYILLLKGTLAAIGVHLVSQIDVLAY
jgi:hypothetical protein